MFTISAENQQPNHSIKISSSSIYIEFLFTSNLKCGITAYIVIKGSIQKLILTYSIKYMKVYKTCSTHNELLHIFSYFDMNVYNGINKEIRLNTWLNRVNWCLSLNGNVLIEKVVKNNTQTFCRAKTHHILGHANVLPSCLEINSKALDSIHQNKRAKYLNLLTSNLIMKLNFLIWDWRGMHCKNNTSWCSIKQNLFTRNIQIKVFSQDEFISGHKNRD